MATHETDLVRLREHVSAMTRHGTELLADLQGLDDRLQALLPALAPLAESEREALVARMCGFDAALPDRLRQLVEALADLIAGLTATDGGETWVRQRLARLEAGEDSEAA